MHDACSCVCIYVYTHAMHVICVLLFLQAVWEGDEQVVDEWISYLKDNPCDENQRKVIDKGAPNWNPLHVAVFKSNVRLLTKLLHANAGE